MRKLLCAFAASAVVVIVVLGCASDTRERLARFFFEVPDDRAVVAVEQSFPAESPPPELTLPPPRFASIHAPFAEKQCDACHDGSARMRVSADLEASCGECHEEFFEDEVAHEPVADGDCTLCHAPHRSKYRALLLQPVFETCTDCHDEPDELSEPAHAADGAENCTTCHDPHFGGEFLLKPGRAAAAHGAKSEERADE